MSPANSRDEAFLTPARTRVLAGLAAASAFALVPLFAYPDAAWILAWSDLTVTAIVLASAIKCAAITRRLHGRERSAWIAIGAAYVAYSFAQITWSIHELVLGEPNPVPSIADFGYMLAPLLLMVGIWIYRTHAPSVPAAIVQLGNAGILVASIYLVNTILFRHTLESLVTPAQSTLLVAYAVVAITAFLFALFNIGFYMRGRRRLVMMPLLLGLGSLAIADYGSAFEFASGIYTSSSFSNVGYVFTFAFGYWAAHEQDCLSRSSRAVDDGSAHDDLARQWESLLPPLAIAGLVAVAASHREELTDDLAPDAIGAMLVFVVSLALRDWWTRRIEARLRVDKRRSEMLVRQSEKNLLEKNEALLAANRELSKEMIARRHIEEELRHSQKMEAIGQLTGGVAHDFNNLLAVIVGNVDLLEETLASEAEQRGYTGEIAAAAKRGAALTSRLLAFSRKQSLDPRPIDVRELLGSMTALLERALGERIELRVEVSDDVAPCMIDWAQLENTILNLVINARDAMRGEGVITIEASNASASEAEIENPPGALARGCVMIAVRDTGVGMSEEVRARVFDPFFTTKDVGSGSGLGLSMVYGFVKQSDGHILIESEPGRGTEVRLYLPSTDLAPHRIERAMQGALPTGHGESVLVAEDDTALRKVIAAFLEEHGYRVRVAANATEALGALDESGPFDLLLSDVILPGALSGPELAEEIAKRQPSIAILLMSGYASETLAGSKGLGDAANLLQKPFSMGQLVRKIRSVLRSAGSAAQRPRG